MLKLLNEILSKYHAEFGESKKVIELCPKHYMKFGTELVSGLWYHGANTNVDSYQGKPIVRCDELCLICNEEKV